jgi:hypothetical protein
LAHLTSHEHKIQADAPTNFQLFYRGPRLAKQRNPLPLKRMSDKRFARDDDATTDTTPPLEEKVFLTKVKRPKGSQIQIENRF